MMYVLCSLYDRKAQSYSPAVAYPDRATASRAFVALLATPDCTPAQWPDDFDLYLVGLFDTATGAVVSDCKPVCLLSGQNAVFMLSQLQQRQQAKGGAVGGTASAVPPEDSGASAERNSLTSTPNLPGLSDPSSPASVVQP